MGKALFVALAAVTATFGATAAQAATFITVGDNTTIQFNGTEAGTSASLFLTLTEENNALNTFRFSYSLTNTSNLALNPTSRVRSFGFDDIGLDTTTGSATTADTNGFDTLSFDENFPTGLGNREFCLFDSPGNCIGGSSGAIVGDAATGSFTLDYAGTGLTQITLDNFAVRFQSTGVNGQGSGTGVPILAPVPEPGTWAMMLLGFGAAGVAMRRRKRLNMRAMQVA